MKQKITAFFAVVLLALTALTFPACSKKTDAEVYFLNFKPEVADVFEDVAKAYQEETGIAVKVVTAASGTYESTLKSEIAKKNAPTIFIFNGAVGYASLASVKDTVKAIKVGGVAPSDETVKDETYAIQRPFVLVTKEGTALTETAQAFFDFITSEAAREVITAAGVVPAN